MSTVNDIKLRSDDNQQIIKSKLKSLENILNNFDNAKEQLVDAIILDAAEAINYWQNQVKKIKLEIQSIFKAYISVVQAQEKTKAALNILKNKYEKQKDNMLNAAESKTSDRWPKLWGKDKSILPLKDNKMTFDSIELESQDDQQDFQQQQLESQNDQQNIGQSNQQDFDQQDFQQQDVGQLNQDNLDFKSTQDIHDNSNYDQHQSKITVSNIFDGQYKLNKEL